MGTFEQGFMGPFRGKPGTAVGSRWKGLYVLRSRPPRKRSGLASEGQLKVQARFSLVVKFIMYSKNSGGPWTPRLKKFFDDAGLGISKSKENIVEVTNHKVRIRRIP